MIKTYKVGKLIVPRLLLMFLFLSTGQIVAQEDTSEVNKEAVSLPKKIRIDAGTPITVKNTKDIMSNLAIAGDPIELKVKKDVIIDNQVVIAAGDVVIGSVYFAEKARGLGKAGLIDIELISVKAVDGHFVLLQNKIIRKDGKNRKAIMWTVFGIGIVLATVRTNPYINLIGIFSPLVFLIKGQNAIIYSGTTFECIVAKTTEVTIE